MTKKADPKSWDDLGKLWTDMIRFAQDNPDHLFLSSDSHGVMKWTAAREDGRGAKEWAICLAAAKKTLPALRLVSPAFHDCFKTPAGRQLLCAQLTGRQKLNNPIFALLG